MRFILFYFILFPLSLNLEGIRVAVHGAESFNIPHIHIFIDYNVFIGTDSYIYNLNNTIYWDKLVFFGYFYFGKSAFCHSFLQIESLRFSVEAMVMIPCNNLDF